jgi:predicted phosphodiesterase
LRILSLSDIHGDMDAFELFLDKLSGHTFDVVLIAGDLGGLDDAKVIFNELLQYKRPILYVTGNWDQFSYQEELHDFATHLHLNHQRIGEWVFLGYSGCAANGYSGNPSLSGRYDEFQKNLRSYKRKFGSYELFCKSIAFKELQTYIDLNQIDVDDLVLITHDRFYSLPFSPLLYVFGHRHKPKHTYHKGIHCLNTSAISMKSMMSRTPMDTPGNFCIVELDGLNCQVEFYEVPSSFERVNGLSGVFQTIVDASGNCEDIFFKKLERFGKK